MTLDSRVYDAEYVIIHEEKVTPHFVSPADSPLAGRGPVPIGKLLPSFRRREEWAAAACWTNGWRPGL